MKISFSQTEDLQGVRYEIDYPCGRNLAVTVNSILRDREDLSGADWINHHGISADSSFIYDVNHILTDEENELTLVTIYDPCKFLPFPTGPTWSSYHHALHWSHAIVFSRHCIDQANQAAKSSTPQDGMH
jgi:hypothetical protein